MDFSRPLYLAIFGALALAGGPMSARGETVDLQELMTPEPLTEQVLGSDHAPVTIVEYASLTCDHCQAFHTPTFPTLKEKYIDTGKVRFILREFPLDPLATTAVMLARCAPGNSYLVVVDLLFTLQREWAFAPQPRDALLSILKHVGFTEQTFRACLADQKLLDDINGGAEAGEPKVRRPFHSPVFHQRCGAKSRFHVR